MITAKEARNGMKDRREDVLYVLQEFAETKIKEAVSNGQDTVSFTIPTLSEIASVDVKWSLIEAGFDVYLLRDYEENRMKMYISWF